MAQKFVAVFLMCMVIAAAMHVREAEAIGEVYKTCYEGCHKECLSGNGFTFCEMKCDTDCAAKESAAKVEAFKSGLKN
ncbi:Major pollen allergen Ole e like [Actinidia chinensis var. chinensis]|uniref:Major pollen allergen Ole e like n=1 Tax=Actinidia chinensis var. chinensis TaxID=1590841 RepID=A0A2R6QE40_ACTCC|nr:Major pollen allergen Ole e like [Actinidia chinensis var. chinensis]